eukprot:Skav234462  [mRNA]  locus=scaffold1647:186792:188957:+ [translate_table: standard]
MEAYRQCTPTAIQKKETSECRLTSAKLEKHRDDEEWVVVIETCHQCECHRQEWLRHDPQDYRSALELAQTACKGLEGARPLRCIHLETPDLGQRIGAFEVFLLPPRVCELRDDMPRLEKSWKLVLHGLKSNLDIFSCWKKAQEEAKLLEEEMGEIASYAEKRVADLEPCQVLSHLVLLVPYKSGRRSMDNSK